MKDITDQLAQLEQAMRGEPYRTATHGPIWTAEKVHAWADTLRSIQQQLEEQASFGPGPSRVETPIHSARDAKNIQVLPGPLTASPAPETTP